MIARILLQLWLFALLLAQGQAFAGGDVMVHLQRNLALQAEASFEGGASQALQLPQREHGRLAIDVLAHLKHNLALAAQSPVEGGASEHGDGYMVAIVNQLIQEHPRQFPWGSDEGAQTTASNEHHESPDASHALPLAFTFLALVPAPAYPLPATDSIPARRTVAPYSSRAPPALS